MHYWVAGEAMLGILGILCTHQGERTPRIGAGEQLSRRIKKISEQKATKKTKECPEATPHARAHPRRDGTWKPCDRW